MPTNMMMNSKAQGKECSCFCCYNLAEHLFLKHKYFLVNHPMRQYLKNEVKIRRKNDRSENESGDSNVCVSREGLLRLIHAAWHGACIAAPAAFTGGDRKRKNGGGAAH